MSGIAIDREAILAPLSDVEPCGEYLYYTPLYDGIRQARRRDEAPYPGGEVKEADWEKVVDLCSSALAERSKDLLLAAWLTEALVVRDGFGGLAAGLLVLEGLVERYWEEVHPLIEDGEYDGRAAPFEFLNEKLCVRVCRIPLTDPRNTQGYGLLEYRESRRVGDEREGNIEQREALLAEGKIGAEEFDLAVKKTPAAFYAGLREAVAESVEAVQRLEKVVGEKFGAHAPSLRKLGAALEECQALVLKIGGPRKGEPPEPVEGAVQPQPPARSPTMTPLTGPSGQTSPTSPSSPASQTEEQLWGDALAVVQGGDFRGALDLLVAAAASQPSERERCRYRLLVAKLCLHGGHPELARPIVEQLHSVVTELQLEKWESPFWISEILEALYRCLTACEDPDEEAGRAKELFRKICTLDVTKALN